MSSISFSDLIIDKFLTFSSKMKDNPFNQSSALCLMGDNPNIYCHNTDLNTFLWNGGLPFDFNFFDNKQKVNTEYPLMKNIGSDFRQNQFSISPHLFGVVHDSIRYLTNQSDMFLLSQNKLNIANVLSDLLDSKSPADQNIDSTSNIVKKSVSPLQEPTTIEVSLTVKNAMGDKLNSEKTNCKLSIPNDVTLNLELANKKTKELQKRSKKRRKRQKKTKNNCGNRSSVTQDSLYNCLSTSPIFSHESYSGTTSKTDTKFCISVNQEGGNISTHGVTSSFVISVESISDDDSEWDSCERDIFNEADFEFGLVMANLSIPNMYYPLHSFSIECSVAAVEREEEANEMAKIRAMLFKINKKWDAATKGVSKEPKLPSKISFATGDKLEQVLPVEVYDRKGEWEMFATERLRFKRRIDELQDIISPCLTPTHRLNVYNKLFQSNL